MTAPVTASAPPRPRAGAGGVAGSGCHRRLPAGRRAGTGDTRLWLPVGAVTGVALPNKLKVAFLVGALVVGLVISGSAGLGRSRWALVGGVVSLAVFSPDVAWNATHAWAQAAVLAARHRENSTLVTSLTCWRRPMPSEVPSR